MADDDDVQWQEEFKVRVSSGFDRLVAFAATELNRRSIEEERVSPKREIPPYVDHYHHHPRPTHHHLKKEDVRKLKPDRDYASDLSNERRMRMMIEENRKSKHHLPHHHQQDD
jgi:hypothetical protein